MRLSPRPRRGGAERARAAGAISLAIISPNGPALRVTPRPTPVVLRSGQLRHHELGEAVAFLQVRVAGEDEVLDAEVDVLAHALRDLVRVADERRAGAAAHQADAGPQVRGDHEVVPAAAVQARHAALADGIEAREGFLGRGDLGVVELGDQVVGGAPGVLLPFAHDHVEADAEAQSPPAGRRGVPRRRDLLGDVGGGLAPGQVDVHVLGRDRPCRRRRSRRRTAADRASGRRGRTACRPRSAGACPGTSRSRRRGARARCGGTRP